MDLSSYEPACFWALWGTHWYGTSGTLLTKSAAVLLQLWPKPRIPGRKEAKTGGGKVLAIEMASCEAISV